MFFLGNNSLLTWLQNNYTDPLLEAGVFATLRTIHSRRDFYFNFCCYGSTCLDSFFSFFSFFFIIIISILRALSRQVQNLIRRQEEEEQWGEEASKKSKVDVGEPGAKE